MGWLGRAIVEAATAALAAPGRRARHAATAHIAGLPLSGLLFASGGLDWRFNLYSMPGLIAIFGMYYAPYVYMFTSAALRNMDPSLEEAAEISGASALQTLLTITFPLIAPAIISSMLLSFIVMLGIYGIPAVLGTPANISVLTTYIFNLTAWSPPLYSNAAAVAIILMVVTGLLVVLQQKVLSGRSFTTVAGKAFRPRALNLGPWRYLTLGLAIVYLLVFIARFLPDTVKALSTSLMQIHRELEEAAWICGRGTLSTIRTVVLPLARPGVIAAMTLLFILAVRELGSSLFLYSSDSMVMAVLLLDYYDGGNISITAAFSLVQMVLLSVLIGIAHFLSRGAADSGIGKAG